MLYPNKRKNNILNMRYFILSPSQVNKKIYLKHEDTRGPKSFSLLNKQKKKGKVIRTKLRHSSKSDMLLRLFNRLRLFNKINYEGNNPF